MNISQLRKRLLEASVAVPAIALGASFATPAYAQNEPAAAADEQCDPAVDANCESDEPVILVTGSLFRRTNTETASPLTTLSSETLDERGINSIAEATQRLSANGAGTITQGWNNGSNFATGANAVSLRGLTVQKTLTIFDGDFTGGNETFRENEAGTDGKFLTGHVVHDSGTKAAVGVTGEAFVRYTPPGSKLFLEVRAGYGWTDDVSYGDSAIRAKLDGTSWVAGISVGWRF